MRFAIPCVVMSVFLCLLFPATTSAKEKTAKESGQGYLFVGFGAINAVEGTLHFGGGGEVNLFKGLGFGAEIGYLAPKGYLGEGVGVLSLDGQYTFGTGGPGRVRPFLTGGYSLVFRSGHANAINFGGGIHYWFARHAGLRLEFRDHVSPDLWDAHAWQGRVGFDFR